MKRLLLIGLWGCCCFWSLGQENDNSALSFNLSDTNYERVYALCIGISEYEHFDTLHYSSKDASSFSQALETLYPEAIIKTLTDKQVSETEVYISLTPFRNEATSDDLLVFFFSGHGAVENTISVSNLILPTTPKHLYFTDAINLKELGDFLLEKPKEDRPSILVIIDACRKGETENLEKTYNDIQSIFKNQATILLACEAGKESIEDGKLQQGVFTYFLLEAIEKCPEDEKRSKNYRLELNELSRYLTNTVRSHTQEKQIPQVVGNMTSVVFSCNTLSESVSVKNAFVSPEDISQLQQDNDDPLHLFNEFSKVLKEGKEEEAKTIYNNMPDTEEAKTLKDVMREKLLERFSAPATSMLKTYIENGLDTLSLSACNEVVLDLEYCLSLIDTSYFRYDKFKGRVLFFQGVEKRIEGDYVTALNYSNEALLHRPYAAYIFAEKSMLHCFLGKKIDADDALDKVRELAPKWDLPIQISGSLCNEESISSMCDKQSSLTLHVFLIIQEDNDVATQNKKLITNLTEEICQNIPGLSVNVQLIDGKDASQIFSKIDETNVKEDDIIWCYYSGYGIYYDGWPMTEEDELSLTKLHKKLKSTNARLTLALFDLVNTDLDEPIYTVSDLRAKSSFYKLLFLESSGNIISASTSNYFSYGDPLSGGIYTNAFIDAIRTEAHWEDVMTTARRLTNETTSTQGLGQFPIYDLQNFNMEEPEPASAIKTKYFSSLEEMARTLSTSYNMSSKDKITITIYDIMHWNPGLTPENFRSYTNLEVKFEDKAIGRTK